MRLRARVRDRGRVRVRTRVRVRVRVSIFFSILSFSLLDSDFVIGIANAFFGIASIGITSFGIVTQNPITNPFGLSEEQE